MVRLALVVGWLATSEVWPTLPDTPTRWLGRDSNLAREAPLEAG